jgi:hypothetical protein
MEPVDLLDVFQLTILLIVELVWAQVKYRHEVQWIYRSPHSSEASNRMSPWTCHKPPGRTCSYLHFLEYIDTYILPWN